MIIKTKLCVSKRAKLQRLREWHLWFSWRPVTVETGEVVWLERIARRYPCAFVGALSGDILRLGPEYRLLRKEQE